MKVMRLSLLILWGVPLTTATDDPLPTCYGERLPNNESVGFNSGHCIYIDSDRREIQSHPAVTCTPRKALVQRNVTQQNSDSTELDDRTHVAPIIVTVFTSIAFLTTIPRVAYSVRNFIIADAFAFVSMALAVAITTVQWLEDKQGLGRHFSTIGKDQEMSLHFLAWLNEIFYAIGLGCIKICFLFLYRHIFSDAKFRRITLILIILTVCFCGSSVLVVIFPCVPLSRSWSVHKGTCIDSNAFAISCAALNLVLDIITLALPIREVSKTNLPSIKKACVFVMFGTGAFVTIVGIIRLKFLVGYTDSKDPTFENVPLSYWTALEVITGIICANLPSLRRFFKSVWRRWTQNGFDKDDDHRTKSTATQRHRYPSNRPISDQTFRKPRSDTESDIVQLVDHDERGEGGQGKSYSTA